jgi:large subunit ribosomal protein L23
MMKLSDAQLAQVKEHGWLREVAFKTTPNVTKVGVTRRCGVMLRTE